MSIGDSMGASLSNKVYDMFDNKVRGRNVNGQQATPADQVKNMDQALQDNKVTGAELKNLREEFVKSGGNAQEFDQAVSDKFKVSMNKVQSTGDADTVFELEMSDDGKAVKVKSDDNQQDLQVLTANFNILDSNSIQKYSTDPGVIEATEADFGGKGATSIKNLQNFLNEHKEAGQPNIAVDGRIGSETIRRMKDVMRQALVNNDVETVKKLVWTMEAMNGQINPTSSTETNDEEMMSLTSAATELDQNTSSTTMTIGPITVLPNP